MQVCVEQMYLSLRAGLTFILGSFHYKCCKGLELILELSSLCKICKESCWHMCKYVYVEKHIFICGLKVAFLFCS